MGRISKWNFIGCIIYLILTKFSRTQNVSPFELEVISDSNTMF